MRPNYKVVVAGSRDFTDKTLLFNTLNTLFKNISLTHDIVIISGAARGADQLGEVYAKEHNLQTILMPANWEQHGKSAGYKRNEDMLEIADAVVCFWDSKSPGTKHMIDLTKSRDIPIRVIKVN